MRRNEAPVWCIIDAPHFYAAAEFFADGFVSRAAPIIRYLQGTPVSYVRSYVRRKRWLLTLFYADGSQEFAP